LVVGDDLDLPVLEHAHARVRRAQIDPDRWCFTHRLYVSSHLAMSFMQKLNKNVFK